MTMEERNISWPGWKTVKLIGRGSYGGVYEIERDIFGQVEKAALKVITIPQNASDITEMYNDGFDEESITNTFQNHLKNIVAEYSLMRKMNGCTNIVNCDDVRYIQHDDGIGWDIYIKMELLTPLTNALPQIVSEETVIKVARDLCTALELCKIQGIIHRDIKPQNIFVSEYGDYKLGDFGIAKTVERTMGGTKIGTYKYMAPEVYNNQPYGSAADLYSLGLVLYWLLNERRMPFLPLPPAKLDVGMDESARARRLAGEQLPEPKYGGEALKAIVMKACAYKVEDRYATAAEMLADLDRLGEKVSDTVATEDDVPQEDLTVCIATPLVQDEEKTVGNFGRPQVTQDNSVEEATILQPVEVKAAYHTERKMEPEQKPAVTECKAANKKRGFSKRKGLIAAIFAGILLCAGIGFWFLHPHSYGEWQVVKEASCTEAGELARKCFCGEMQSQVISKLEHTVVIDPVVDASCLETGLTEGSHCSACGAVLVEQLTTPMVDHDIVALDAVPATCAESGLTSGTGCSVCGYVEVAQEVVEALGHTPVKDAAVASTCAKEGKTEGSHCSVCGEVLEKQQTVSLLSHTPVTDKAVAATCTSTGKTEGSHCSVCGMVIKAQQTTSKISHTIVTDKAVAATCTEAGKTEGSHCSVCGTVIKAQTTTGSALGHSFSANECIRCGLKEWYAVVTPSKSTCSVNENYTITITIYSNNPNASSVNVYLQITAVRSSDGYTESRRGNTVTAKNGYTETQTGFYASVPAKGTYSVYTADGYYLGGCTVIVE